MNRNFTLVDRFINEIDVAIRTLIPPKNRVSNRLSPALYQKEADLNEQQKKHISGLLRVNHSGEVCAQALYQGQALTAKLEKTREKMAKAAEEEVDHLAWCEQRLYELNAKPSLLNAFWYTGSLFIGALAGFAGDKYSLGFVAETEYQVSNHLQNHLKLLPEKDLKTKAILDQMYEDETHHADTAVEAGAVELPQAIKTLMSVTSKLLTKSSYYI